MTKEEWEKFDAEMYETEETDEEYDRRMDRRDFILGSDEERDS